VFNLAVSVILAALLAALLFWLVMGGEGRTFVMVAVGTGLGLALGLRRHTRRANRG
jgi:predicted NBD/HSP70 family sugar kinase